MSRCQRLSVGLSSIVLDPSWGLTRNPPRPPGRRPPDYEDRFDFHTLCYDVFLDEAPSRIQLVCPRLFNLEGALRGARLELDGRPATIRSIRTFGRMDVVTLDARDRPTDLTVIGDGWRMTVPIRRQTLEAFRGLNCLLTVSRDNDPTWVTDWVRYHVREHGARAVLLFDNGSTRYAVGDLEDTLASVDGLGCVAVVSAPFPHGAPGRSRRWEPPSKFLQTGLLNLAARRFLPEARAVLSIDVDELVWSAEGRSVFDEAAGSRLGYVRFPGEWVHPPDGAVPPFRHRDHVFRAAGDRRPEKFKWCAVPGGPLQGHYWDVHRVRGVVRRYLADATSCRYWHFAEVSTHWKGRGRRGPARGLVPDEHLAGTMSRVFPEERSDP